MMKTRQKIRKGLLLASLLLFPVTLYYFSPALSLQGAAGGVASGSVMVFAGLFASALVLGRAFCGWACPMGGLQELTARLRGRPVARRRLRWIKYLVWGPWFLLLVYFTLQAGGFRRADFTWQTWHGISVAGWQGLFVLLAVAAVFFLPALLVGRRASCHTLCWVAPFLIAGRAARNFLAWPALRLTGRPEACQSCGSCAAACPMSIDVQENLQAGGLETTDCILCGSCADACPNGALHLGFGKGRGSPPRPGRTARGSSIVTLLALTALLLAAPGLRAESLLPLPASLGGMGGPTFRFTWFAGQRAMLGGGPAYLILDGRLYLGLNGSYLEGNTDEFMIGYGGPSAGWLLFPGSRFSLWLGATAALGGVREPAAGGSGVFVLEPEAIAQLAIGPYSRLGLGASYRLALPFEELAGYGARELSGPSLVVRLAYGVFGQADREAGGAPQAPAPEDAPPPPQAGPPRAPRIGLVGSWSQKFSLVRGQLTRFDGGYTRLILKQRWALGAMGYRTPGGTKIGADDFQMMESGVWVERLFEPSRRLCFSVGALTGVALVGYITPAEELVGSPAFLFNPEALGYLNLSDFVRLSASLGWRTALPFRPVPGLEYWDCNGPTVSLNLVFGVFTPR